MVDVTEPDQRWARLEEISRETSTLYAEKRQLEAVMLDPFIGRFFKFELPDETESKLTGRLAMYFYVAR